MKLRCPIHTSRTFRTVAIVLLGIVLVTYFGGVRFRGGLPGGLVAVAVGTALAWATGLDAELGSDDEYAFYGARQ